jgi:ribosomal protein S18 acetylase RimI-like enzyme
MAAPAGHTIARVREEDLPDVLPLMAAYLAFYETSAEARVLEDLCRALLADPRREGVQLLARGPGGSPAGFATVYWSWSTTRPGRMGVMNDLWVEPAARGTGLADALIAACAEEARAHGARTLTWMTAPDNRRAQAVYDRSGATASSWLEYELEVER